MAMPKTFERSTLLMFCAIALIIGSAVTYSFKSDYKTEFNGATAKITKLETDIELLKNLKKGTEGNLQACEEDISRGEDKLKEALAEAVAQCVSTKAKTKTTSKAKREHSIARNSGGNTFETIKGGDRECVVYFNGKRMYSKFVWGNPEDTKKACDAYATEMHSIHSSSEPVSGQVSAIPMDESATTQLQSTVKNHTCELKFNGDVVETTKTVDDSACKTWTLAKAQEKGWVPR